MSDLISRQAAISAICNACGKIDCDKMDKCEKLQLPPANCSEFPNNSDTISRAKAIDGKICIQRANGVEIYDDYAVPVEYLKQLPPAQPEPRWIPVSERLPEDDDIVLITMDDSITVRGEFFEQISNELGFFKEGVWHWGYEIGEAYWPETTHVTAWMPLPEPYKEENE